MGYDNMTVFRNIHYLLNKQGKNIGDFEASVELSKGYISKMQKSKKSTMTLEKAKVIADNLSISLDILTSIDLTGLGDDNILVLNFLKSLEKETISKEIAWKKIEPYLISKYLEGDKRPDLGLEMLVPKPGQNEDYNYSDPMKYVYKSQYFGDFLYQGGVGDAIPMPWFKANLDDNTFVIMTYMYVENYDINDYVPVIELFTYSEVYSEYTDEYGETGKYKTADEFTSLCSSMAMGDGFKEVIKSLYDTVHKLQNEIKISDNLKNVLSKHILK